MTKLSRETVIRAALDLLNEVGVDGLSTRRLAERLGVQQPALYWHFKNKRELLDALSRQMLVERHTRGIPQPGEHWRAFLHDNAMSFRRGLLAYRDGARIHAGTRPDGPQAGAVERSCACCGTPGSRRTPACMRCWRSASTVGAVLEQQAAQDGAGQGMTRQDRRRTRRCCAPPWIYSKAAARTRRSNRAWPCCWTGWPAAWSRAARARLLAGTQGKHAMIDHATLLTYLAVLTGFVLIPGPAVLLTLARAATSGTRVGMATGLGIAAGDLIHTCMAVLGLSAILMTSAFLFNVVKYAGAAYLVYLGVRVFLEQADLPDLAPAARVDARTAFRQAILAEVLNPKSALFFLAFLPQFVRPQNGPVALQLATLGVLFVLMGALSTGLVALCAGRVGRFLRRHPAIWRWQGKAVGTVCARWAYAWRCSSASALSRRCAHDIPWPP